ncbi:electron transfer flavoprotein subunit alpha/FixB family protein [Fundidesulfovibrio terrae]|uniref:electron transfer flavoprotein subunit alpha/FixB family protein n=1 Tax=Fundidesulfovibrio terrae TaxID=2922866 RepID=UPI001FAF0B7D|nr:electron transfer flavoprotein subunit alpha [Fundidesulfovibrio terrae]
MSTILFAAQTECDGSLGKASLEALSAAKTLAEQLGADLAVGLVGSDVQAAADSLAGCGAKAIYGVSGDEFAQPRYATDAAALAALYKASGADIVIGAATSRMSRVLPGAAARVGGRSDTGVTALAAEGGKPVVTRWYYRQRMYAELTRQERPWFISVSTGCFTPYSGDAGQAQVTAVTAELPAGGVRTRNTATISPSAEEQTIRPDAALLFVAGAGWTKKQPDGAAHLEEAEQIILQFLGKSQGSLGTSKSLVDLSGEGQQVMSFLTHMHQVGQTGATPRHPKGLATCCHGEEPHTVGWRFIGERRAINLDANCGWAQGKADVVYVADAFEVMRKILEMMP